MNASKPPAPADGTVVSSDHIPIRYHVEGLGEPALVFVHCWACDRHFWDAQVARFAGQYQIVTLDLAGHGESGGVRTAWTMAAFGEDVRSLVEKLDLKRVVLIGHSMGGSVILEAARRIPDRVAALVPVDTLLNVDEKEKPEEIEAFLAGFRADFKTATGKFLREWMFVPSTDPKLIERIVSTASSVSPEMGISALQHAWSYDARAALREIKAPIRAINADKFPTNLEAARRYAPQFDAVIMKGVGHYLMLEDPERFNQLLAQVLKDLASGATDGPTQ